MNYYEHSLIVICFRFYELSISFVPPFEFLRVSLLRILNYLTMSLGVGHLRTGIMILETQQKN